MVAGTLDLNQIIARPGHTCRSSCSSRSRSSSSSRPCSRSSTAPPFDIPVAESEIVGGYFIEYSGIRWSMFQLTEYATMWAFSVFGAVVFLGGWEWPMGDDWSAGAGSSLLTRRQDEPRSSSSIIWVRTTVPAPAHRPAHELLLEGAAPARARADLRQRLHPRLRLRRTWLAARHVSGRRRRRSSSSSSGAPCARPRRSRRPRRRRTGRVQECQRP